MDYPPSRLVISVLDDGYFSRSEGAQGPVFSVTAGGRAVEAMMRATVGRCGGPAATEKTRRQALL